MAQTFLLLFAITKEKTEINIFPAQTRFNNSEVFPQPLFGLTLGNTLLPRVFFIRVSYRDQCYSVLLCSDRDTILVLHPLTPEKVGLPGSELSRSRSVVTSRCKQW